MTAFATKSQTVKFMTFILWSSVLLFMDKMFHFAEGKKLNEK